MDPIINRKMSYDILFKRYLFTIDMYLECIVSKSTEHKQQQQKKNISTQEDVMLFWSL
jgi:hypothetical protein